MARFYGEIEGRRANVHRLHHGPLIVRACSWHGGVETEMWEDADGRTMVAVSTIPWRGAGKRVLLYNGTLAEMFNATEAHPLYKTGPTPLPHGDTL